MENRNTPLRSDGVNIMQSSESTSTEPLKPKIINAAAGLTPDVGKMKEIRARFSSPTDSFLSPCTQLLEKSHFSHIVPKKQITKRFDERLKENILQDMNILPDQKKEDAQ